MYTVVIVDDEPWALQGLAEIIDWNNEGFSIEQNWWHKKFCVY